MFDVSFSEFIVIGVVALIVIGPERMPRVARTAGHLVARLQRYVSDVKADINREMQLEDLKKLQQQIAEQAKNVQAAVEAQMKAAETTLATTLEKSPKSEPAIAADSANTTAAISTTPVDKTP
jgi:sec-independent protein translocase protein TatB